MVTVPREYGPSVQARPLDPVYQNTRGAGIFAFGTDGSEFQRLAQGVSDVGNALGQIALKQQIEDNEREAKGADTAYKERLRVIQFGDGTPENPGFYAQQGENAVNAYGQTEQAIQKARAEVAASIQNDKARELFDFAADDQDNFVLTNMGRHYSAQREVANDAVDEARINEAADEAASFRGQPEAMARAFSVMNGSIQAMAERKGWSPEVVASKQQEAQSVIFRKTFNNIILDSADAGEQFFLDNKARIDAQLWPEFERDVKIQRKAEQSEAEHRQYLARVALEEQRDAAANEWISTIIGGQDIDLKAMAADPRLQGSDKITIANLARASTEEDRVSTGLSQTTTADLFARIALAPDDPRKIANRSEIDQAFIDGKLKRTDHDWLVKSLSENATPDGERLTKMQGDFLAGMKSQLTRSNMFLPDPQGDAKYYEFQQYVTQKVIEARRDKKDPYTLFRPDSPDYLGSAAVISQFQRSLQEITQDNLNRLRTPAGPRGSEAAKKNKEYKAAADVVKDYNDGRLTYEDAAKILKENGWAE